MQRYSAADVRAEFMVLVHVATQQGFRAPEEWVLQAGGEGCPWRAFRRETGQSGLQPWPFPEMLGWTSREAYETLAAYVDALKADRRA